MIVPLAIYFVSYTDIDSELHTVFSVKTNVRLLSVFCFVVTLLQVINHNQQSINSSATRTQSKQDHRSMSLPREQFRIRKDISL